MQSKTARERLEGMEWLGKLSTETRFRKTDSSLSNGTLQELLASAIADPNVSIGDKAYGYLATWNFLRTAQPGHCLEVVAPMRKSAIWSYDESKDVQIGTPIGVSTTCIPPDPNAQN
jgi:hypothetical protein